MYIHIHGLVIRAHCRPEELLAQLLRPFKYFIEDSGLPAAEIFIVQTEPPYDSFPALRASFSTPRNIVFKGSGIKIIDYFGKGVVVEENGGRKFTIYGRDPNFLQEALYLLVMSVFGRYCDSNGILRIHALAFSFGNTAVILSANTGGGKSTMAFAFLDNDNFKLISDDEALVNKAGRVLPFPLGIGTLDEDKISSLPCRYVYETDRMEYGKKFFADAELWGDKLERRELDNKIYFVAQRLMNGDPRIEKISGFRALVSLIGSAVIGLGLYQGIEFVFNNKPQDIISLTPVFIRRMIAAVKLSSRSESYKIYLSRDTAKNMNVFENFVKNHR